MDTTDNVLHGTIRNSACSERAQTPTTITFTLDEPCKTSAGVFLTNGTLIRTLWSKVPYSAAGTYSAAWDGLDDNSNAMAAGTYQIKLLQNNVHYVWDGAIGNSSSEGSGSTVHGGFYFIRSMALFGSNAFYVSGYDEGQYDFREFYTNSPESVAAHFVAGNTAQLAGIEDVNWNCTATGLTLAYFASYSTYAPGSSTNLYQGCITSFVVSNLSTARFMSGVTISNGQDTPFPGIYVGTHPGITGISVESTGNILAVSVAPDNTVYLIDKLYGTNIASISVPAPRCVSFSTNGTLWVVSSNANGGNIICYSNLPESPSSVLTLSNFKNPLAVAVCPTNSNIILAADGGTSQQLKAFNEAGTPLWTYGLPGGYQANGVAVATNKFWFSYEAVPQTFIAYSGDGSFWVGDEENHRAMHYDANHNFIDQIMYQPCSYVACADQNKVSRVFNQFLEFNVDYTKPISNSWTLVNNWKANVPTNNIFLDNEGLMQVTTLTNGRTYALVNDSSIQFAPFELCELVSNQWLRMTGIHPLYSSSNNNSWGTLGADGSFSYIPKGENLWYKASFNRFDTSNNILWNPPTLLATSRALATDPIPRCCSFGNVNVAISTNNVLISIDQSLNNGWHFGGLQLGTTNWLWEAGPSVQFEWLWQL